MTFTLSLFQNPPPQLAQVDQTLLLQYLTALLISPVPPNMTSTMMKLLECSFNYSTKDCEDVIGLPLTKSLAELNFPHFKTLLYPILKRYTAKHADEPSTIRLLAGLARTGKIIPPSTSEDGQPPELWLVRVEDHLLQRLNASSSSSSTISQVELQDILVLLPICRTSASKQSQVEGILKNRISHILDAPVSDKDAKVLGTCLSAFRRFYSPTMASPLTFVVPDPPALTVKSPPLRPRHSRAGSSLGSIMDLEARKSAEREGSGTQTPSTGTGLPELVEWIEKVVDGWAGHTDVLVGLVDVCLIVDQR